MSEHFGPQLPFDEVFKSFRLYLESVERVNWQGKKFYRPGDVEAWMKDKPQGQTYSNDVGLVSYVYGGDGFERISPGNSQCLLVFAALLHPDVNRGDLIHNFSSCGLTDNALQMSNIQDRYNHIIRASASDQPPRPSQDGPRDIRDAIAAFDRIRWAFCPAKLKFHLHTSFYEPCILPFFYEKVINTKGGTANVYHYKIQEDLIDCKELKEALESSKHNDPKLGSCYEFAVKSYVDGWDDAYNFESEAYRGIRDQPGVVKYLGEYHFMDGDMTKHNIILEYGQQDLDEYLADTYPPVLNAEIIAFWEEIFKVAYTLRDLHQFSYTHPDKRIQMFKGWHGDIKPDNILRVHGTFKVADFGFAKFERDESGRSSTFLSGGTEIYGAPECDASRRQTRTPQLQTIDTWSFGCVLSAVATWVILGSQAYDNYRQVRRLAIATLHERAPRGKKSSTPSAHDCFHDGKKVLTSVLHWHDFLRNSARRCDTITSRILDLIENKMLLERPESRLNFEDLCENLDEIVVLAKDKHQKSVEKGDLKKVYPDTLKALLTLDKLAPAEATPSKHVGKGLLLASPAINEKGVILPGNKAQSQPWPVSKNVRKSERLEKVILGKTANREKAIKFDLQQGTLTEPEEICDSPQQSALDGELHNFGASSSSNTRNNIWIANGENCTTKIPEIRLHTDSPLAIQQPGFPWPSVDGRPSLGEQASLPKLARRKGKDVLGPNGSRAGGGDEATVISGHESRTPATPPYHASRDYYPQNFTDRPMVPVQPGGQRQSVSSQMLPPGPQQSGRNFSGYDIPDGPIVYVPQARDPIPPSSQPQPEIYKEYTRLQTLWRDKKGTFSSILRRIPEDPYLKKFISNRDIVFVMDNAASMVPHWDNATCVLLTLAMKIGPLDKDGLDLVYTIGETHEARGKKGWGMPTEFENSMKLAKRDMEDRDKTNMGQTLRKIFDGYTDFRKKLTLIILTDGIWKGSTTENDVENSIVMFITNMKKKLKKFESRWFSIQFVYFGDNEQAIDRLQRLDDKMPIEEDVIDSKPWWHSKVDQLILGSMLDSEDQETASLAPVSPSQYNSRPSSSTSYQSSSTNSQNPISRSPSTGSKHRLSKFFRG